MRFLIVALLSLVMSCLAPPTLKEAKTKTSTSTVGTSSTSTVSK